MSHLTSRAAIFTHDRKFRWEKWETTCTLRQGANNCGRQEQLAILFSRLQLRMRRMYVASIRLEFH